MTRGIRTTLVIFAALAVALVAAGCAPDEDMMATDSPNGPVACEQVDVSLREFSIDMPASISAGAVAFVVTNGGSVEHNFEVEGEGIAEEFDEDLAPGETRTLELELEPGTYEVYCPVANHASSSR